MGDAALKLEPGGRSPDVEEYWEEVKSGQAGSYGYLSLVGLRLRDPIVIMKSVEAGLPIKALERFQRNTQLSTDDLADLVAIKPRTLNRRREKGRLAPDESDRLLRVSRLFGKALELFEGDPEAARRWLKTSSRALGGKRPITLARTDLGSREVEALIDRLEHGVLT